MLLPLAVAWSAARERLDVDLALVLSLLGVLANFCYRFVYAVYLRAVRWTPGPLGRAVRYRDSACGGDHSFPFEGTFRQQVLEAGDSLALDPWVVGSAPAQR